MSGTNSKLKAKVERSRLDSKEEAKLDTTYDKILDRISGVAPKFGLNFVVLHRDYNSEKGTPKLIKITNRTNDLPLAEFSLTESIEYNFLNADSPKFKMDLVVSDMDYTIDFYKFSVELGKILNVHVEIVPDRSASKLAHRKA